MVNKFIKRQAFLNKFQKIIWDQMGISLSILRAKIKKRFSNIRRTRLYKKSLKRARPIFYKVEVMHVYKPKKRLKYLMRLYYEKLKYLFYYNKMKQNKIKELLRFLKKKKVSLFKKFLYKFECRLDILLFKLGFIFSDVRTTILCGKNAFCYLNGVSLKKLTYSLEVGDEVTFSFFWFLFLKSMYILRFKKVTYNLKFWIKKKKKINDLIGFKDFFLKIPNFIEFSFKLFEFILVKFPTKYDIFCLLQIDLRKLLVLYNNIF